MDLIEQQVSCPYFGERIEILVNPGIPEQSYIEDCQVCCRPIKINVTMNPDSRGVMVPHVEVFHENE